jgi:alpha-ribazole phosphatase
VVNVFLVRHTRPDIVPGVCYGRSDIGLPESCGHDFRAVAERLNRVIPIPSAVFSSPAQRCHRLATFLYPGQARVDARLQELDFGQWELQAWDAVPRADLDLWTADLAGYAPPAGESFRDLYARCRAFATECLTDESGDYCIIAHGGVIRALLAFFLQKPHTVPGDPAEGLPALLAEPIDYGAICHLRINPETDQVRYHFC